jgi:phosphate transport system permease protein
LLKERVAFWFLLVLTLVLFLPFFWILSQVLWNGSRVIAKTGLSFFTARPPLPGFGSGGVGPELEGSLIMVALACVIVIPVAMLCSFYLVFYEKSSLAKLTRSLLELVVEFPTIVVGISVFVMLVVELKFSLSALTGALALSVIMLPYTTIQATEAMRTPKALLEEAGYALGLTQAQVFRLVLSAGRQGVLTGILIGFAKIFGETAPLLFTTTTSFNLYFHSLNSPVAGLPTLIFFFAFSPYDNWHEVAWGASLVLALSVMLTFVLSRLFVRGGIST